MADQVDRFLDQLDPKPLMLRMRRVLILQLVKEPVKGLRHVLSDTPVPQSLEAIQRLGVLVVEDH